MKTLSVVLSAVLLCLLVQDARSSVPPNGVAFPMKYEGGSLSLSQHDKLKTTVGDSELTFVQGKQTVTLPLKSITEVSYGNDVHRRVGTAIGLAVVSLGIGALMLLAKTKKHYVGVVWADKDKVGTPMEKGGVVFKVGKGEYRGFIAALEGKTGLKAVDADAVGKGGTSKP
jgi:hypothetical protein